MIKPANLLLFFGILVLASRSLSALAQERLDSLHVAGQIVKRLITEDGDTILLADLGDINVTAKRTFKHEKEKRHYYKMRYYATKVYPYGVEAVRTFRQIEAESESMKNRKRKKYVKDVQRELEEKFAAPLKELTRTQGYILIKMVERELEQPIYDVVKDVKGGFSAGYWNQFGKVFGYDLKKGYHAEDDPVLEMILKDLDFSSTRVSEKE